MGLYLNYNRNKAGDSLATNSGWGEVTRWADGIDASRHPQILHLVEFGWVGKLPRLAEQIKNAMRETPPSANVKSVLDNLLSLLETAPPSIRKVSVTNGMS